MRPVHPTAQSIREERRGIVEVPLLWLEARDRDTGVIEGMGLWGGADTEAVTVTDMFTGVTVTRLFIGMGSLLHVGPIRSEAGLHIRPVEVTLSSISEAVRQAIRGYEPRGAQAQLWKRVYRSETMLPVAVEPLYKGYVNFSPINRPPPGGEGTITLTLVSTARMLTIASARKKSHEAQQLRMGDQFRKYKAVVGEVDVPWGQKDARQ